MKMTAEAVLAELFAADPYQALTLCDWVTYTARHLAALEEVPMPLSYAEWRYLVGYPPGAFDWEGEQAFRAAFYAAQPGRCA